MHDFRDMEPIDIETFLLKGNPFYVDNIKIVQQTLGDMVDNKLSNYLRAIGLLTMTIDDFMSLFNDDKEKVSILKDQMDKLREFDFLISLGGEDIRQAFLESLSIILMTNDIRILDNRLIAIDFEKDGIVEFNDDGELVINEKDIKSINRHSFKIIDRDNYMEISNVLKLIDGFPNREEVSKDSFNPVNERTRRLKERMDANNKRIENIKKNNEGGDDKGLDLYTLIDSVSTKSNSIDKFNVWNLTKYQLFMEYLRIETIVAHDITLKAMLAGAENMDLDSNHWAKEI